MRVLILNPRPDRFQPSKRIAQHWREYAPTPKATTRAVAKVVGNPILRGGAPPQRGKRRPPAPGSAGVRRDLATPPEWRCARASGIFRPPRPGARYAGWRAGAVFNAPPAPALAYQAFVTVRFTPTRQYFAKGRSGLNWHSAPDAELWIPGEILCVGHIRHRPTRRLWVSCSGLVWSAGFISWHLFPPPPAHFEKTRRGGHSRNERCPNGAERVTS